MNIEKLLTSTIRKIVKKRSQTKAVEEFKTIIEKYGWPMNVHKDTAYRTIDSVLQGQLLDDHQNTINMLLGCVTVFPKLNEFQKARLNELKIIIQKAKSKKCQHDMKISVFYHGGGLTPILNPYPELICSNCGLNITVFGRTREHVKKLGLSILQKDLDKLYTWAAKKFKEHKVQSASIITADPIRALNSSEVYPRKFPFKITNLETFESKSGT